MDRRQRRFLATKHGSRLRLLGIGNIVSATLVDGVVWLSTRDGTRHRSVLSLREIEDCVDPGVMIRVSRGAIVNVDAIQEVEPLHHGDMILVMSNGERIKTARQPRQLMRLLFEGMYRAPLSHRTGRPLAANRK